MHYVIQENVFREQHYDMLWKTMERLDLPYSVVRIFPYIDRIVDMVDIPIEAYVADELPEFNINRTDVFCFGAVKLARIASEKKWSPGSLLNSNHDFMVYREHYRDHLLNWDSKIQNFTDKIEWLPNESKFLRPTQDTKSFTGKVYEQVEWEDFVHYNKDNKDSILSSNPEIQVTSVKKIQKEIRFWVVGGKVITGSQYKLGTRVAYDDVFEDSAQEFAQSMVDIFQLAEAFVIDVALVDGEWKVVECGCINCAGFYKANLQKLIISLEDYFDANK